MALAKWRNGPTGRVTNFALKVAETTWGSYCTIDWQEATAQDATWRTGQIDPELPFEVGPMNGREARGSGLWPKALVAPRATVEGFHR
jgi:hypothetical protein